MRILLLALFIATLTACGFIGFPGVYKINVEQGNIVTPEMVGQLKPGMTRRQVKFILGTALVEDTFNKDRWVYLYSKRNGRTILSESQLTVEFDGDALVNVTGDLAPSEWGGEVPPAMQASGDLPEAGNALPEPPPGIPVGG